MKTTHFLRTIWREKIMLKATLVTSFRTAVLAMLALQISTGPTNALSCVEPHPERSVQWASERGADFTVVYGDLEINTSIWSAMSNAFKAEARSSGTLSGENLATGEPISISITIAETCFGPWCSRIPEEPIKGALYFLTGDKENLVLTLSPCGGSIFWNTAKEDVEHLLSFLHPAQEG